MLGGAPAAAVVFSGQVDARTAADPRVRDLAARVAAASGTGRAALTAELDALRSSVRAEKLTEVATEFGLGVSRNVLATRLSKLVDDGILERVPYLERPPRYEYVITAKGRDLAPVLVAFMHWGDTYLAGENGPPRDILHNGCGGHVRPGMVCSSCGDEVAPQEITLTRAAPVAESA